MSDLISRADAIEAVSRGCKEFRGIFQDCEEAINELPSIQPRKGKWIKEKDGYNRCSECGSRGSAIKARYCHHCGADMRGEQE